jgi:hypothetical protein
MSAAAGFKRFGGPKASAAFDQDMQKLKQTIRKEVEEAEED